MFEILEETTILYPDFPRQTINYVSNNKLNEALLERKIGYDEKVYLLYPDGSIQEIDGIGNYLTISWVNLKDLLILKNKLDSFSKIERMVIYNYNLPPFCDRPGSLEFFTRE